MKKFILIILGLFALASLTALNITYPECFDEETMTIHGPLSADLEGDHWETGWAHINNDTDEEITIVFQYTNHDVPEGWAISVCNTETCYMADFPTQITIPAGGYAPIHYVFYYGSSDATFPVPFTIDSVEYNWTFSSQGVANDDEVVAENQVKLGNYPNPFNPVTALSYNLTPKQAKDAKISVYNSRGQLVKIFNRLESDGKRGQVIWNGKDNSGKSVSSGIYYYRLTGNGFSKSKKMVLMK
ncbi:MAG: hypothetical protein CSB55_03855 [Candidatus Cloacimonadota bacterium]|nr:MAG: hypothetical protein CSB55_03855 [Candidatus Cloacimonadota bacterium]